MSVYSAPWYTPAVQRLLDLALEEDVGRGDLGDLPVRPGQAHAPVGGVLEDAVVDVAGPGGDDGRAVPDGDRRRRPEDRLDQVPAAERTRRRKINRGAGPGGAVGAGNSVDGGRCGRYDGQA